MDHAYTKLFENAYDILNWAYRREYHLWNVRLGQPINDSKDFDSCFQAGERLDLAITVVATMGFDMSSGSVNMAPFSRQTHRHQPHRDRYPPRVQDLSYYETTEALLRERMSLGLALLWIYPGSKRNAPDTFIEYRSRDSMARSTISRIHQSGLTKIHWNMELPIKAPYCLSPRVGGDMMVTSSSLRFPASGRMWRENVYWSTKERCEKVSPWGAPG